MFRNKSWTGLMHGLEMADMNVFRMIMMGMLRKIELEMEEHVKI